MSLRSLIHLSRNRTHMSFDWQSSIPTFVPKEDHLKARSKLCWFLAGCLPQVHRVNFPRSLILSQTRSMFHWYRDWCIAVFRHSSLTRHLFYLNWHRLWTYWWKAARLHSSLSTLQLSKSTIHPLSEWCGTAYLQLQALPPIESKTLHFLE